MIHLGTHETHMGLSPLCYFANLFTLRHCLILRGHQNFFFNTFCEVVNFDAWRSPTIRASESSRLSVPVQELIESIQQLAFKYFHTMQTYGKKLVFAELFGRLSETFFQQPYIFNLSLLWRTRCWMSELKLYPGH